jgi:hypothetical protein
VVHISIGLSAEPILCSYGAHTRASLASKSGWARVPMSQTGPCVECHEPDFGRLYIYRVSGLEVLKNTCLCFSEICVFNSVQSNSKRFLCTSAHFSVGTCCSSTDI